METPLHKAAWAANHEVMDVLIHAGADINITNKVSTIYIYINDALSSF